MREWAAAILVLLSACARHPETPLFTGEPYLLVWAGDADRQNSDFLAVLDGDPTSPSYGKVLRTYPVRSRGNEPQALIAAPRADRHVFASGVLTDRTFVFDVRQPLAARLVHIDEPGPGRRFGAPHDYVTLPNGHVVATCADPLRYRGEPREILGAPGGLVELDADGGFVREIPAADPAARHLIIAPFGAAASPSLGPGHDQRRARLRRDDAQRAHAGHQRAGLAARRPRLAEDRHPRRRQAGRGEPGTDHGALPPAQVRALRRHRPGQRALRHRLDRQPEPGLPARLRFRPGRARRRDGDHARRPLPGRGARRLEPRRLARPGRPVAPQARLGGPPRPRSARHGEGAPGRAARPRHERRRDAHRRRRLHGGRSWLPP